MANPLDFLVYGPAGALKRSRRDKARERALDLTERQALIARNRDRGLPVDEAGFITDLPTPEFGARDELELSLALADAGLNEKGLADAREQQARTRTFLDVFERLRGGAADPGTARAADFTNKKTVAPVGMSGGVAFDRYDPAAPILDESSAVTQLAAQRRAQAAETDLRTNSLRRVLSDPGLSAPVRADIANQRAVYKPQRVKVRRADGSEVYMDATPNLGGGYDYAPASDATGEPLRPPAGAGERGTALQTDTAFIAQLLQIPPEEAILLKLESKGKSDQALWEETVLNVARADPYGRLNAQQRTDKARELWQTLRPQSLPPVDIPPGARRAPRPSAVGVLDTGDDEDAAFDAERATGINDAAYDTPEAVREAFRNGELDEDEAIAILQRMGFE